MNLEQETRDQKKPRIRRTTAKQLINRETEYKLTKKIKELTEKLSALKREEECLSVSLPLLKKTLLREHEIVKNCSPWDKVSEVLSGVYFLILNKKVVYVGQSKNILVRICAHKDKKFDSFAFLTCRENEMDIIESLYIHLLQPEQNGLSVHGVIFSPMTLEQMLKRVT